MRDTITVKENDEKVIKAKRLLLLPVHEAHEQFLKTGVEIGITKFYELRPEEIVLPETKNIHKVCVCEKHGNVDLKLENSGLLNNDPLGIKEEGKRLSHKNYIKLLTCTPATDDCHEDLCDECKDKDISPTLEKLKSYFLDQGGYLY